MERSFAPVALVPNQLIVTYYETSLYIKLFLGSADLPAVHGERSFAFKVKN